MDILNGKRYNPVGYCIYCGTTDGLTDEHIVPYALGGTSVLPNSSCKECAKITGRIEQKNLRGWLWKPRLAMKLPSRTKHGDAPKLFPIKFKKNRKTTKIAVPIEDFPILAPFPVYGVPRHLTGQFYPGIGWKGIRVINIGPKPKVIAERLCAESLLIEEDNKYERLDFVEFAKMIAKIAFAYAAAEGQLTYLDGVSPVISAILGQNAYIGQWVGTLDNPTCAAKDRLHVIGIIKDEQQGLMISKVHLFSNSETPIYGVILGKLK